MSNQKTTNQPTALQQTANIIGKTILFAAVSPLIPAIGLMWLIAMAGAE